MSTLSDLGYTWASLPSTAIAPLQLLVRTGASVAEQMNTTLSKLFVPKNVPIPIPGLDQELPGSLNLSQKLDASVAMNASFLQNLLRIFSGDASASFSWEKHSSVELVLNAPKKQVLDLIDLDTYIHDANLNQGAQSFVEKLKTDQLYIITEIIKTKSFTVTINKGSGTEAALEVPTKVVNSKVSFKKTQEGNLLMTTNSDNELTVAVRAVRIFFDKPGFLSGKPGKFRLSNEERLDTLRGEENFPAENLDALFLQPESH
ncbi:MAG TPA: hypothetical protein VLC98_08065 [Phnomibacter sp.]|nr:hypothetical protein [Phnomibacter sp.]